MKTKALRKYKISVCDEYRGQIEFTFKKGQKWRLTTDGTTYIMCSRKNIVCIIREDIAEKIFGEKVVSKLTPRREKLPLPLPNPENLKRLPMLNLVLGNRGGKVVWKKHVEKEQTDGDSN